MSVTNAIKNQVVGRIARALTSNLVGVQGNLQSRARRGPSPSKTSQKGIADQGIAPKHLSYPLGVAEDSQQGHYIMFMINESTPGKIGKGPAPPWANDLDGIARDLEDTAFFAHLNFIDTHLNKGAGAKDAETFRSAPPAAGLAVHKEGTIRMAQAITLYMPPSVKVSYKSNYNNNEIGSVVLGLKAFGESLIGAAAQFKIGEWGEAGGTVVTAATQGILQLAADKAVEHAGSVLPGATTIAQLSAGAIIGSKMEVMFKDVGRRNFSFQFNFIPKSEQEAKMVYKIVQTFKEHMLPEHLESADFAFIGEQKLLPGKILKIPDTFDIHYFYHNNENPFLNRISTCYLTSMDIDYGGEKYVTYEPTKHDNGQVGPPPQRTAITLTFTEIETITRERAKQGF